MPGFVQRLGDPNSGGGLIMSGDPSVLVNGRPIATFGASVTPHPPCNKVPVHCHAYTQADQFTVLVNGKPVSTFASIDTCGHTRGMGSPDVIIGGS